MLEITFVTAAFFLTVFATTRSLGLGISCVVAAGYLHGMVRSNYVGWLTTFFFDFALLGLYAGAAFVSRYELWRSIGSFKARYFLPIIIWPAVLSLLPVNDILVQLVSLRAHAWVLPAFFIAAKMKTNDVITVARFLCVLNPFALGIAYIIYSQGLGAIYPRNAVTELMYQSQDVAGGDFHRIPSCFLNAHGYGITMLLSLPYLIGNLLGKSNYIEKAFCLVGTFSAILGIFLCGGRQPVVIAAGAILLFFILSRAAIVVIAPMGILLAIVAFLASGDERMQRVYTLEDTEMVMERVQMSANESFFNLMLDYPLGAGMGSAFGNSIPFFLASRAPRPIGMENEYAHILVDQGFIGLCFWLLALSWLFIIPPIAYRTSSLYFGILMMYCVTFSIWATAFIGVGILSAVPCGFMLLTQMGLLSTYRELARYNSASNQSRQKRPKFMLSPVRKANA